METIRVECLSVQNTTEDCYTVYRMQQVYVMEVVMVQI
jgi:hypothetical protein